MSETHSSTGFQIFVSNAGKLDKLLQVKTAGLIEDKVLGLELVGCRLRTGGLGGGTGLGYYGKRGLEGD
jgi:hypothetical protein